MQKLKLLNKWAGWSARLSNVADIRLPAVIISLLLSAWITSSTNIVNNDAVLYISAAQYIDAGGLNSACLVPDLKCWPLYPALIVLVSKVTSIGYEDAAYLLNAMLSGVMVFAFITLVRVLGADRRTMLVAAFVILSHPYLNESRADIIRGHGYWAFYLLTLYSFICYWRRPEWTNAIAWALSAVVATLFRIEGIVFLMLLPLVLLIQPIEGMRWRTMRLIKAYTIPAVMVVGLVIWWLFDPENTGDSTLRLFEPFKRLLRLWEVISTGMSSKVHIMGERVLGKHIDEYALFALWVTLVLVVVSKIVNTLTPLYAVMLLFRQLRARFTPPAGVVAVFIWLMILNFAILLSQIIVSFFLSARYAVPLALTAMLIVPFALVGIYDMWLKRSALSWKIKWIFPLVLVSLLFMTVDGIYSTNKDDKSYLREGGFFLRDRLAVGETVYADDLRLFYYTGQKLDKYNFPHRSKTAALLKDDKWRQYDHVALITEKNDEELLHIATDVIGVPAHEFRNDRRSGVVIFSNKQSDHEVEKGTVNVP